MRLRRMVRWSLCTAAALLLLAAGVAGYAAYLLNGEGLRLRVEAVLTSALGRPVTMAHLRLSPWAGSAIADDFRIADDPAFSTEPFVQAGRIRLGLDIPVLLLQRKIRIRSLALQRPAIHLLRDVTGRWNYASLGSVHSTRREGRSHGGTNVDVSSIVVEQATVLVRTVTAKGSDVRRSFAIRTLQVRDLGAGRSSRFSFAAQLPAGGSVLASGFAGPWNESSAMRTPVQAHLEADHLQLAEVGLVSADAPLSGDVEHATVDLQWDASAFRVSQLRVDSSRLVIRSGRPDSAETNASQSSPSVWTRLLQRLVIEQAQVHAGAVDIDRPNGSVLRLRSVQAALGNWSPGGRVGFTVSTVAGGGTLSARGSLRVPAPDDARPIKVDAEVSTTHLHLASSGLLPQGEPVDAVADSSWHVQVAEHTVQVAGSFRLAALRMARNGLPSAVPVTGSLRLHQVTRKNDNEGTLEQVTVQLGSATLHTEGTYVWSGTRSTIRFTVRGDRMPVDALESFLPSAGVVLPEGSRLQGGTLTLSLEVKGSPARPEVSGPVRLEVVRLNGFDLGSKLRSLANFTGGRLGSATVSGTQFRSLSFTLHTGLGIVITDHLSAEIAGIGTATGSGSIGPGGALDYHLALKLNELVPGNGGPSGLANEVVGSLPPVWARRLQGAIKYLGQGPMKNGVPLLIRGTAHKPTVMPDLGALLPAERHH